MNSAPAWVLLSAGAVRAVHARTAPPVAPDALVVAKPYVDPLADKGSDKLSEFHKFMDRSLRQWRQDKNLIVTTPFGYEPQFYVGPPAVTSWRLERSSVARPLQSASGAMAFYVTAFVKGFAK